jgi:hypothetical protein
MILPVLFCADAAAAAKSTAVVSIAIYINFEIGISIVLGWDTVHTPSRNSPPVRMTFFSFLREAKPYYNSVSLWRGYAGVKIKLILLSISRIIVPRAACPGL